MRNNKLIIPYPTENYRDYALSSEEFYQLAKWIKQVKGIKIKVDSAYTNLLIYLNNGRVNKERSGCKSICELLYKDPMRGEMECPAY